MTDKDGGAGQGAPNILLICTDQHRYDAVGCYGNDVIETPALDGFARQGVVFDRCYTQSPVCAPGRASMLTGVFPHAHGLWANGVTFPGRHPLLGRILADRGYDCGLAGRFHLSAAIGGRTEPRMDDGFRSFSWANDPSHMSPENRYHHWVKDRFPELWRAENERVRSLGTGLCVDVPTEAHFSHWVAEETIQFITEDRDHKPSFFVANFFDPHHPFVAPKEYLDRYRDKAVPPAIPGPAEDEGGGPPIHRALSAGEAGQSRGYLQHSTEELREIAVAYYAMVSLVDDEVGRILDALQRLGLAENTLVIFTSDHGEMLGDHAQLLKGPLFYEGAVRVPYIVRWPGHAPEGARCQALVQTIDTFALCMAAAGVPLPESCQAIDPLAVAAGTAPARGYALCEYRNSGDPLDPPVHATMLRTDRHKLVVYHGDPRYGELYDLDLDPQERVNEWSDPGASITRLDLTGRMLDALVATEDRSTPRDAPW